MTRPLITTDPTHEGVEHPMSGADYALCDSCERKVFYDADTDIPVGTVILHVDCALKEQAAAEARGYGRAIANLLDRAKFSEWHTTAGGSPDLYASEGQRMAAVAYLEAVKDTTP